MQVEKDTNSKQAESAFTAGQYETAAQIAKSSMLYYAKDPALRASYYYQFARFQTILGWLEESEKLIQKQEKYVKQLPPEEQELPLVSLYDNKFTLYIREVSRAESNPYTTKTLQNDPKAQALVGLIEQLRDRLVRSTDPAKKRGLCSLYNMLGNLYSAQLLYDKAQQAYQEGLASLGDNGDVHMCMEIRITLGDLCQQLRRFAESIGHYTEALKLANRMDNRQARATCHMNLAFCTHRLLVDGSIAANYAEGTKRSIKDHYLKAIQIFSTLEQDLVDPENQVTYFNIHDQAYISYENYLYTQGERRKALVTSLARPARALKTYLEKKLPPGASISPVDQIQQKAAELNTTFLVYSLAPCQLERTSPKLRIWVISQDSYKTTEVSIAGVLGKEEVAAFYATLKGIFTTRGNVRRALVEVQNVTQNTEIVDDVDDLVDDPTTMDGFRALIGVPENCLLKESIEALDNNLSHLDNTRKQLNIQLANWTPLLLPNEIFEVIKANKHPLTIIPEGHLADIPFAALRITDAAGKIHCLIEEVALSIAPSLPVLELLQAKRNTPVQHSGNPQALVVCSDPDSNLRNGSQELRQVKSLFRNRGSSVTGLKGKKVHRETFLEELEKPYDYIHVICHGTDIPAASPDSAFQGGLLFTSKVDGKKHILGNDIAKKALNTRLVFMSSCLSGKGKIHQEGNVGLVWAFLAAGAESVISCHWPLYDSDLTLEMVQQFYLSTDNKATALQLAMRHGINKHPNNRDRPDKWGLWTLSGLS